jgi:hypothetical protein
MPASLPDASPAPAATGPRPARRPWFREPWPWLLFFPPAVAVVAGIITMGIAVDSFDGVVSDDYYRQGLAINQSLERDAHARERGLSAQVRFNPAGDRVRVSVSGVVGQGELLSLRLVRAARSGDDQQVELVPVAPGLYDGSLARPLHGRWHLQLEDAGHHWRIAATAQMPAAAVIGLEPAPTRQPAAEDLRWSDRRN